MNGVLKAWTDLPPLFADRLMALLTAPGRLYHGLHRVNGLLLDADRFSQPHWLRPLRWAILYRYAVFDPLAGVRANAEASVELWAEHFPALHETARNVSGTWEEEVAEAILAAAAPFDRPTSLRPWQHALIDLDCGMLGAAPPVYAASRLLMAAEHAATGGTEEGWSEAQATFAAEALACPTLFHIVHRDREAAARANLRLGLSLPVIPGRRRRPPGMRGASDGQAAFHQPGHEG